MWRVVVLLMMGCFSLWAESPSSFSQSKKIAAQLFRPYAQTIYCQCAYEGKTVNLDSCGMQQAQSKKRAHRIEWEHIQAAEHFGKQFECWRKPLCEDRNGKRFKGRRCCQQLDARYRHVESELYNLWPEVGLVNQARSNYRFGMVSEPKDYYGCGIAIDKASKKAEPSDVAKGIVARAYLFMASHYQLTLSDSQRQLFKAWNRQFPPNAWERHWAEQVAEIEGYDNPYISQWEWSKEVG